MSATDLTQIATRIAARMSRMRRDGSDPRPRSGKLSARFDGYPTPPSQMEPGIGWLVPYDLNAVYTNNANIIFAAVFSFPHDDLPDVMLSQIYPVASPHNEFGILQTLQRPTYAGLEVKLGGNAFADTDDDAYDLGPSASTNTGRRWFTVNVTDITLANEELEQAGQQNAILAARLEVQIPSL